MVDEITQPWGRVRDLQYRIDESLTRGGAGLNNIDLNILANPINRGQVAAIAAPNASREGFLDVVIVRACAYMTPLLEIGQLNA